MKPKPRLLYDADCPICAKTACWVGSWDRSEQFELGPLPEHPEQPATSKHSPRELLLIDEKGASLGGWDAVCGLLRHHPILFWLGHIGSWPLVRNLGRVAYRWFARNRYRFR